MTKGRKPNTDTWHPVAIRHDTVLVGGGYHKAFIPTEVRRATVDTKQHTFLKISRREPWLIACASGSTKNALPKGKSSFVETLKHQLTQACNGRLPTHALAQTGSNQTARSTTGDLSDDEDLIPLIELLDQIPGTRGKGRNRMRYYTNHCKGRVIQIEMPATAPPKDPTCTEKRMVCIYVEDRRQLWIDANDAEWAMKYVQHELECHLIGSLSLQTNGPGPEGSHPPPLPPLPPLQDEW